MNTSPKTLESVVFLIGVVGAPWGHFGVRLFLSSSKVTVFSRGLMLMRELFRFMGTRDEGTRLVDAGIAKSPHDKLKSLMLRGTRYSVCPSSTPADLFSGEKCCKV